MTICPDCKSINIDKIGYDIYPDEEEEDVIEEDQYICFDCDRFFCITISMKHGMIKNKIGEGK